MARTIIAQIDLQAVGEEREQVVTDLTGTCLLTRQELDTFADSLSFIGSRIQFGIIARTRPASTSAYILRLGRTSS